ncbi:MAG: hypothetical protein HZB38_04020 [Planctomycetes bacterium]|nr:hypothetical protein [Planctomycetota bacterium]
MKRTIFLIGVFLLGSIEYTFAQAASQPAVSQPAASRPVASRPARLTNVKPTRRPASRPASQPTTASQPTSQPTSASRPAREYHEDRSAGYKLEPGPYAVDLVSDFPLYDKRRDKNLPLLIRCPKNAPEKELLPLVVFSHGAGGAGDAFGEWSAHLASHGYVVVHPTHDDSLKLRRKQGEDLSALRADPNKLRESVNPAERLADVRLILDSLDKIEDKRPELKIGDKGRIDRNRIAIAGHSAGAYTAQVALGAKVRLPRHGAALFSIGDDRIKAAVIISGQGLTNKSLSAESWKDIKKPMLVFAGSLDVVSISNETPESRRHPFEYAAPGEKYLVYIDGATHGSYQGRGLSSLLGEEPTTDVKLITDTVASATLAFLDSTLGADSKARTYLAGDGLVKLSGGAAEFKRK